jgi:glycosyltransferase involved in cell wall biosynthesis
VLKKSNFCRNTAPLDRLSDVPHYLNDPTARAGSAGPVHICFVAPHAWPVFSGDPDISMVGGAEVQQSILARMLARAGYRVSMICLDYGQPQAVEIDGVTVYKAHRPDAGLPGLRFIHPRLTGMVQAMRLADADIYYQRSTAMLTAVVAAFCRRHGKRSIYAGASDTDFVPGQQLIRFRRDRWLFERGLLAVDRIIVQNAMQQRSCLENYGRVATVIPSCYELPAGTRRAAGKYALWVGVLRRAKRPELFLDLARRLPLHRFVMIGGPGTDAGDDSYFEHMRRIAADLPNVEFTGFLPLSRVEPYFDQARVFVNTSVFEGMPNTFLQAWARGVPTVAYIDTGSRLHGEAVYPSVQSTEEAAGEVDRLFSEDIHHRHLSSLCREYFVQTHGAAGVLAHYERLLDELAPRGGREIR